MILDCHVHSWRYPDHFPDDIYFGRLKAMRGEEAAKESIKKADRPTSMLIEYMDEAGIDTSLVLPINFRETVGIDVPNDYTASAVKPYEGRLYWGACVNLTDPGAPAEVERCVKEMGAVALGELGPIYGHYSVADPRCYPVYEVAGSLNIPVMIHAGPALGPVYLKYANLWDLDEVCVKFPDTTFVLCHFGEPDYELASYMVVKNRNLFADVSMMTFYSSLNDSMPAKVVSPHQHLDAPLLFYYSLPASDHDKLLFASDLEVPKQTIDFLHGVNPRLHKMGLPTIPKETFDRMIHENWQRVYTKIPAK